MNFLRLRSINQTASHEQQSVNEPQEDAVPERSSSGSRYSEIDDHINESGSMLGSSGKMNSHVDNHSDVTEDDGIIIIPYKEVPDNWSEAPDMHSYQSLDRSFVFPGEQIQILVCLSSHKQNTEVITPFKVAAIMNKNGSGQNSSIQNGKVGQETQTVSQAAGSNGDHRDNKDSEKKIHSENDVQISESLIRREERRRQTGQLLQRFKDSHFFARISESNEPLWSKRTQEINRKLSETFKEKSKLDSSESLKKDTISAVIDRGDFDARTSGGVTRGAVRCCSLSNGDIVVLLQVNVGVEIIRDPVLEILQFEKYHERTLTLENGHSQTLLNHEPYGELLEWLLPLSNSSSPRPPVLSSSSSIRSTSSKAPVVGSPGSQMFSFGHFRSYSMSSLPPNATPSETITTPTLKPSFQLEDWNQFSFKKLIDGGKGRNEGMLSFRGMSLVPEKFSVSCGLEGIFTPGRRWRRKIKLFQPIEIHSFSVDCNTDDLLCVHVKNISPENAPDIVVFVDSVTIIFDEASIGGPPSPIPTVCIEAGNNYSLPNLELRKGEEHSFILKPAMPLWKCPSSQRDGNPQPSHLSSAGSAASTRHSSSNTEVRHGGSPSDRYAVLVSCHCNYTESKLFFKQPISWKPRIPRDLRISVSAEIPKQTLGSNRIQLPIQVLTLQASNMTFDDMTLTFLAPTSYRSPSEMSNNATSSHLSLRASSMDIADKVKSDKHEGVVHSLSSASVNQGEDNEDDPQSASVKETPLPQFGMGPVNDLRCTHLWLQSRVPLGCLPSQSTATIKLEVLPLTGGLIFVPEKDLKISASSCIVNAMM
ncbi:uncharacterized protein LOC127260620 isoform X2 [Andrographis paniculata]|uniref:uncharacterized protein LOC127260620 isoform X2 n=1 Tax=Andrographis paniculata TaxID=175694 RepID=UPI0021E6F236|nr:uncharacterized protein LOC127260620 isoform X2 [Andrographis paniculata]